MDSIAPAEPMIVLEGVSKRYDDGTLAVAELSLTVNRGEVAVLVGPSGCGKTTTMRMINRLVDPSTGTITVAGRNVMETDVRALRRSIGYVIQQVGLFPHLTVRRNVATVCRLLGWDSKRTMERADQMLELVGLNPDEYGNRYPHQLSGGQRQRVGVARALAPDPPVLLMDEPFGAVDPIARSRLQEQFLLLQRRLGTTVVIVTHDIDEAVRLGDRIAVMRRGGHLDQYASPAEILSAPATPFVAEFTGSDRTIKLLAVTGLNLSALEAVVPEPRLRSTPIAEAEGGSESAVDADSALPTSAEISLPEDVSLRDALAAVLDSEAGRVPITNAAGEVTGVLTLDGVHAALRSAVANQPVGE